MAGIYVRATEMNLDYFQPEPEGLFTEPDICANKHGGNENSVEAHGKTNAKRDRDRILAHIKSKGMDGATCYECEQALVMRHATASARISELKCSEIKVRYIGREAVRRKTDTGCWADVYIVK